jgi:hypothetical protein
MTTALDKVIAASAELTSPAPLSDEEEAVRTTVLVEAAGSAVAEACRLLGGVSLDSCPTAVVQAAATLLGASAAFEGLELAADDDWVEATSLDVTALALAGGSDSSKPYGDVPYADPGYQKDGKKRYPLDIKHLRAAITYFSQSDNREPYTSEQIKTIWGRIKSAASKAGVSLSPSTGKVAASAPLDMLGLLELAAKGQQWPERTVKNHPRFHGGHEHDHMHLNDNRHGPSVAGFAAGNNSITAYNHPPMTGMHAHAHVHANDATHGPMRAHDDDDWGG